jgi:hypothetical protein
LRGRISVLGWVHLFALVCAAIATLVCFSGRPGRLRGPASFLNAAKPPHGPSRIPNALPAPEMISAGRPVYPYSVIPGGVENAQELKNAVLHDPVVAGHYADFNLAKARIVRLDNNRAVYVSYRLGDRVYWTKKALKLFKGERLISDGVHQARARCGNRLSYTPAQPVSPLEPTPAAIATPLPPTLFAVNQPPPVLPLTPLPPPPGSSPPGTPPGGGIIPPPIVPIGGGGSHPKTPPVVTPEPGTSALLAIGLVTLLAAGLLPWIRKKRDA